MRIVLLLIHNREDLDILDVGEVIYLLLGHVEQIIKLIFRYDLLLIDVPQLDDRHLIQDRRHLILYIIFKFFNTLLTLVLESCKMEIRILSFVFLYLIAQVKHLFSLNDPRLDIELAIDPCLAVLEVYGIRCLSIFEDNGVQKSKAGKVGAIGLKIVEEDNLVTTLCHCHIIRFELDEILIDLYLRVYLLSNVLATAAQTCRFPTKEVVMLYCAFLPLKWPE